MDYQLEYSRAALKQLKALPINVQKRIQPKIDALTEDPRPNGVVKLEGEDSLYRIKVGSYRVIYEIQDAKLWVFVIKVGNRQDVYKF
jgi:mRNA interferase RelE/StbE